MALLEERLLTDIAHETNVGFAVASDGDIDQVSGLENIRRALYRRLLATPGSLVHRPDYGVGIKNFLNSVNSIANQQALATRIQDQFERDFRVESFVGMRVDNSNVDPSKVVLFIKVDIVGFGEAEMEFIPFGETVNG